MRLAIGIALTAAALVMAVYGFLRLTSVLEHNGYGTTAVRDALVVLGVAGALLAGGIATIIWDISKRYERPSDRPQNV